LSALVPTGQQNNQLSPTLLEIDPVTWAIVDSQLRDTFANWRCIARVSSSEPFNPCLDARSRMEVAQRVESSSEQVGLANFNHEVTVAVRLHIVKAMRATVSCPTWRQVDACGATAVEHCTDQDPPQAVDGSRSCIATLAVTRARLVARPFAALYLAPGTGVKRIHCRKRSRSVPNATGQIIGDGTRRGHRTSLQALTEALDAR